MSYSWGAACPLLSTFHPRLAGSRPPYPVLPSIKGGRASARDLPGGQGWASGVPGVPEMSGKCVCSPGLFLEAVPFIGFSKNIVSPKGWVCVLCSRHPQAAPRCVLAAPPGLGPAWVLPPVTRAFPARGFVQESREGCGERGRGPGTCRARGPVIIGGRCCLCWRALGVGVVADGGLCEVAPTGAKPGNPGGSSSGPGQKAGATRQGRRGWGVFQEKCHFEWHRGPGTWAAMVWDREGQGKEGLGGRAAGCPCPYTRGTAAPGSGTVWGRGAGPRTSMWTVAAWTELSSAPPALRTVATGAPAWSAIARGRVMSPRHGCHRVPATSEPWTERRPRCRFLVLPNPVSEQLCPGASAGPCWGPGGRATSPAVRGMTWQVQVGHSLPTGRSLRSSPQVSAGSHRLHDHRRQTAAQGEQLPKVSPRPVPWNRHGVPLPPPPKGPSSESACRRDPGSGGGVLWLRVPSAVVSGPGLLPHGPVGCPPPSEDGASTAV